MLAPFREIGLTEKKRTLDRLGAIDPRNNRGSEVGFRFDVNGYTVIIWTSYLRKEGIWRVRDVGHVLITKGDTIVYQSRDIRRTKNFLKRLLSYAWIAMWKIFHLPACPCCGRPMHIENRKYRKYWWQCDNIEAHPEYKKVTLQWDNGLPTKAQAFVDKMRKPGQKYRRKLKKAGKKPFTAMRIKKPWRKRNPQNKL